MLKFTAHIKHIFIHIIINRSILKIYKLHSFYVAYIECTNVHAEFIFFIFTQHTDIQAALFSLIYFFLLLQTEELVKNSNVPINSTAPKYINSYLKI